MTASLLDARAPHPPATRPARDILSFTVGLEAGMDGPLSVLTMLRGRRYDVVDTRIELRGAHLTLRIAMPESGADLLLERLRRIPVVLDAHRG